MHASFCTSIVNSPVRQMGEVVDGSGLKLITHSDGSGEPPEPIRPKVIVSLLLLLVKWVVKVSRLDLLS